MDNLGAHKVEGVQAAIEATGANLPYPPAYSPDLDPTEPVFAKLKTLLRKAQAQTADGPLDDHRQPARCLPARRMRQLHRQQRLSST
jgi:transposase